MGPALCGLVFVAALLLTYRSAIAGLGVVFSVGYFYGITRANIPDSYSHFIFDSAVLGFYLSYFGTGGFTWSVDPHARAMQRWTLALIGWTVLMFLVPMQHPFIQLVGLRGNCFLLPFILVGTRFRAADAYQVAVWLSVLNHVAFAFAIAEFILGVPVFFPRNDVTELIYRSADVAGQSLRIPSTFSNSHNYGGTMVITLPWLLGAWIQPRLADWQRFFLVSGMGCAMLGVFLCAARMPIILLGVVAAAATFSGYLRGATWVAWSVMIAGVLYVVSGEERMQRFASLQDTDYVISRIEGSVNMNFFELLVTYPFGNGIGAGGTSVPFFLQHLVKDAIFVENEYSRILLEQGVVGLVLWLAFLIWFLGRKPADKRDPWRFGKTLCWFVTLANFAISVIGVGLMTSIPGSILFFVGVGFVTAPPIFAKRFRPNDERPESDHANSGSFRAQALGKP